MKEIKPAKSLDWISRKTDQEVFTDRETCKEMFYKGYEAAKNGETFTLYFYGIGGYGKTTLLDCLKNDVQKKGTYVVKYDSQDGCDKVKTLAALWRGLKDQTNDKFIFSFFEPLLYLYESITQKNYSNVRSFDKANLSSDVTGHSVDLVGQIMSDFNILLSPYLPRAYNAIHDIGKITKAIIESYKRKKEFQFDSTVYDTFTKCVDKKSIEDNIGYLLKIDIEYNVKKFDCKPIIFMIDTIERMVDEKYNVGTTISAIDREFGDNFRTVKNNWLFGINGLIRTIKGVYWVLAGRNQIFEEDDEQVYSFKMDPFTEDYAIEYLMKNDILDPNIQKSIIKISQSVPVYLSLCVEIYLRKKSKNMEISPKDFELMNLDELAKRYCQFLNKDELRFLRIMSLMKTFTDEEINNVFLKIVPNEDFDELETSYKSIISSSNIYKDEETKMNKVNDIVSKVVINDPNFGVSLKHKYLDGLLDYYVINPVVSADPNDEACDKFRMIETIGDNIVKNIIDDELYLDKYISKCIDYDSNYLQERRENHIGDSYCLYSLLETTETLFANKKFDKVIAILEYYFNGRYFNGMAYEDIGITYGYNLDSKYLYSLDKMGNYKKLKENSSNFCKRMQEYIKDGFYDFSNQQIFNRHVYYSKALYHLKEYDLAVKESDKDSKEAEQYFKKEEKGYIYNKLLNSLCYYRIEEYDEAFSIFSEIEDKYDDMFDIIDSDIKDDFLTNYYKHKQQ